MCEDTAREQSKVGSRNIFENLNRLLETTGPECDDAYASIGRSLGRSGPEGEGGDRGDDGYGEGGRAFFRGLSVDPDER